MYAIGKKIQRLDIWNWKRINPEKMYGFIILKSMN
jgi:hypothetical protein